MRIGLAPAIAGRRHAHQAGVQLVLHIAPEHAFLDQRRALRRRAFIVDVERTAATSERAVVNHSAQLRGHALPDTTGERGSALAIEIAFQAVTDRLVQQHAGPAGAQHDRHVAGRRRLPRD